MDNALADTRKAAGGSYRWVGAGLLFIVAGTVCLLALLIIQILVPKIEPFELA